MTDPPVTCLCLTMEGRGEFLKRAVDCFHKQDYPNKQLLIVADWWSDIDGPTLRKHPPYFNPLVIQFAIGEKLTIGGKRNLGNSLAQGSDLIAHWDDDDYSAPGRLSKQVEELRITGKAVTGFRSMKFENVADASYPKWWDFRYHDSGFVIGSSLMYRRDFWLKYPFPEINVGEDSAFCAAADAENQLAEVPDLNLMYATIHAGNTSKRDLSKFPWTPLGYKWERK